MPVNADLRVQIDHVVNLYGHVIDRKQWDRLDEVFTVDGSFLIEQLRVRCHGLPAITEQMRDAVHPLAHYHTNLVLDEEGPDRVAGRVNVWAPWADGTAVVGWYDDELVRTPAGWRFRRREVHLVRRAWPQ